MNNGPITGYRALDLTDEKGFLCGKILADLGVDVIKVEKPGGDSARNIPPFYHDEPDPEKSLYWFAFNANKRGITLNLETSMGQVLFKKLAKKVDFVIESFPPGYMTELGLDYASLTEINPKIIVTSITPFGQTGPYANYKASDIVVQALGVLLGQQGDPDRAPVRTTVPQAYMHAGADAAEATLIANYYRGLTGEGQHIDAAAMDSVAWTAGRALPDWDHSKTEIKRRGSLSISSGRQTPAIWMCKDGYIAFTIWGGRPGSRNNQNLTDWMDSEGMAPSFMKEIDWENWDWLEATQAQLDSIVEAVSLFFEAHSGQELQDGAREKGMMLNKICDSADSLNNIQLRSRGFWVDIRHDELNDTIIYPGAFAKFSLTPIGDWKRAPLIGEHNHDIYHEEIGMSVREIDDLKVNGTI
ncbi:CaiB/BaiF CoA transferase family protein [Chloroflexota bacterium]